MLSLSYISWRSHLYCILYPRYCLYHLVMYSRAIVSYILATMRTIINSTGNYSNYVYLKGAGAEKKKSKNRRFWSRRRELPRIGEVLIPSVVAWTRLPSLSAPPCPPYPLLLCTKKAQKISFLLTKKTLHWYARRKGDSLSFKCNIQGFKIYKKFDEHIVRF